MPLKSQVNIKEKKLSDQIHSPTKMKLSLFYKIGSSSLFVLDSNNNIHLEINATINSQESLSIFQKWPVHLYFSS